MGWWFKTLPMLYKSNFKIEVEKSLWKMKVYLIAKWTQDLH